MTTPFELVRRDSPLLLSIPHSGQDIPADLRGGYTDDALRLADTDWHLDRLYGFAEALGATTVMATVSRYVIDLNRPPTGESLYPTEMISTTLCPTETFRGDPLYRDGQEPAAVEIARRVETYWRPYHQALMDEIARLRQLHGRVLLWDAHSIASILPRLFPGKLPDFSFGTADGTSCHEAVAAGALAVRGTDRSWVVNGRFKGGFIIRRYGAPADDVHAIQFEMCQSLYMDEAAPFAWRPGLADRVRPVVQACVAGALSSLATLPVTRREAGPILTRQKAPLA